MTSTPITGVYNDGFIAELYERYRGDPASVDASWRQYFRIAEMLTGGASQPATTVAADVAYLRRVAGAAALIEAIRKYGHFLVQLDPLGSVPIGAAELAPEFHGITEEDLALVPAPALGFDMGTAADVAARLRQLYTSNLGFEFEHLENEDERRWFRWVIEKEHLRRQLAPDERRILLRRLTEVDALERFIHKTWANVKRFSIEGTDALVPMLDVAIHDAAPGGTHEVVFAMAHRGRINVLAHILGKPLGTIFDEFDGKHADLAESETGDVKYHLGFESERAFDDGRHVGLTLVPNPSHLEVVNPVLIGLARAKQRQYAGDGSDRDEKSVLPVLVHGDASFPGEGVVAETFNLSRLRAYRVGGTLHIICNNQVGFTTNPADGRSTYYASDLAKGFEVPIVHVNADDPEACVAAVRLGIAYRQQFAKDFLIDLVGYRRWGHNEGDEPSYTQPTLYAAIRAHKTARQLLVERFVREGVLTEADASAEEAAVMEHLERAHSGRPPAERDAEPDTPRPSRKAPALETAVRADVLVALNERMLTWPESLHVHPRLAKQLERRRNAMGSKGDIDWGHAEALAFASLLAEGVDVRLTGQDTERGTFSHRHALLNDVEDGSTYTPLQHLPNATGRFEIANSPLTEMAVLGFEYGFSTASPGALVLWEAQFGDFANMAQPVIDQFIAADTVKWGQESSVVLLLPHGYEGQGPEHSSARLERFLQLSAEGNIRVAYPTSAGQYFHILRRQAKEPVRRPLVLMTPKSMLRLSAAAARLEDLTQGKFRPVIDDPVMPNPEEVTRLVLCTGKLYHELVVGEKPKHLAIVRVEELYPWPHDEVSGVVDTYPNVVEIVWAQEEPKNMGSWSYVAPRLRASAGNALIIRYVGRPERASPAEGSVSAHQAEQARIVADVLAAPNIPGMKPPRVGVGR